MPSSTPVRSATELHGSALASRVAMLTPRYTQIVGARIAAPMRGASWVAARTGTNRNPLTSTSAVQLSRAEAPASTVSVPSAARSTSSATHTMRSAVALPRQPHAPIDATHAAYTPATM